MYTIKDKINHFEEHLVHIKTEDGFEILDYYDIYNDKPVIQLATYEYIIKIDNIKEIRFIKDDFSHLYDDVYCLSLKESKFDH